MTNPALSQTVGGMDVLSLDAMSLLFDLDRDLVESHVRRQQRRGSGGVTFPDGWLRRGRERVTRVHREYRDDLDLPAVVGILAAERDRGAS